MEDIIDGFVKKGQWMVQGVLPNHEDNTPPFYYTIGLTSLGIKELVLTGGIPQAAAAQILNSAAKHLIEQGQSEFEIGTPIVDMTSLPMVPMEVQEQFVEDTLCQAYFYYGKTIQAQQLVWPDKEGLFPWDEKNAFAKGKAFDGAQPLLFGIAKH